MTGGPLTPIGLIPTGLLGFLQLKQLGRLPDGLMDSVQPSLDMRDWYFQSRRETALTFNGTIPSNTTSAVGEVTFSAGGTVVVPAGEYWYVESMTVPAIISAAADTIRYAPDYMPASGINDRVQVGPDVSDVVSATVVRNVCAKADRGFWMIPGDTPSAHVFDIKTAGTVSLFLTMRFTRLKV